MKETTSSMLADRGQRLLERPMGHAATYIVMCAAIMLADIFSGPHILLAITYVIPVSLAAWHRGYQFALVFVVLLPASRIPISVFLEQATPLPHAIVNAAIRIAVLWLVAKLVTTTSRHTKELEQSAKLLEKEVNELEGLLPICSHCKKIRDEASQWQPIERYISTHSEASFSHGICPECLVKHYGEFVSDLDDPEDRKLDD